MFNEVVYNIFRSEDVEDKKEQVESATDEFKNLLSEKSLLADGEETIVVRAKELEDLSKKDAIKEKSMLDSIPTSFREEVMALSEAYEELAEDASEEEKLRALQAPLNSLGEALVRSIQGEEEVEEDVEVQTNEGELNFESMVKALEQAVRKANEPVLEELSLLKTSMAERQKGTRAVPPRRGLSPSLVRDSQVAEDGPKKEMSPLSKVINKSVGLPEDYERRGALIKDNEEE